MTTTRTPEERTPDQPPRRQRRGLAFQLAALGLVCACGLAGTGLGRLLKRAPSVDGPPDGPQAGLKMPANLFVGWNKPDLVLLLSGQQNGYVLPCGCSDPQYGGLERRYNLVKLLRDRGWPVAAFDLGDVPQTRGPVHLPNVQGLIKYRYSMMSLKAMGYTAVGLGAQEAAMPLDQALAEYALQPGGDVPRIVVANLIEADVNFPDQTASWKLADPRTTGGLRVGVTGVVGPDVAKALKDLTHGDRKVRFSPTPDALKPVLAAMDREKVDLRVMLYQEPLRRPTFVPAGTKPETPKPIALAEAYPQFPIVLCLSVEDNPPSRPTVVKTKAGTEGWVVTLGHKGKHIGVVGVWKTGQADKPFEFRYQMVELGPEFSTPKGQEEQNPVLGLLESYTAELRDSRPPYLERYGQVKHLLQVLPPVAGLRNPGEPGEPTYVGSEKCKKCHESAYQVWEKSAHYHAYQTLVEKATRPGNRQYDPECIVCHTVGFGYHGGFVDARKTPLLKDVGCESCHGPASLHVKNPGNLDWQKHLNPWRLPETATQEEKSKKKLQVNTLCQRCHDEDNDVTYKDGGFERKWPQIEHMTPKAPE